MTSVYRPRFVYEGRPLPFRCPPAANLARPDVSSYGTHLSEGECSRADGDKRIASDQRGHQDCRAEWINQEAYGDTLSTAQRRALKDLARCRTAALGGHVEECDQCGHRRIAYNSCRNRHCPKCQAAARAQWLDDRASELLPTPYFHVVFTLPDELGPLALRNPRVVYGTLFRATAETLLAIAADHKQLGAEIGFLAALHTWGQNLHLHPHLHCVVPGGGLAPTGDRWIGCQPGFFLPVKVLSRVFRGKFLAHLEEASAVATSPSTASRRTSPRPAA